MLLLEMKLAILFEMEDKKMIKIMIFNQKGGVGKSTTVVDIAGCLSLNMKKKVLVIDIDGQCTSTSYLRTIEGEVSYNLYDYIQDSFPIKDIICPISFDKWSFRKREKELQQTNIYLLPSSRNFSTPSFNDNFQNLDLFKDIFSQIDESEYDYCIFDCPGHINKLTESAMRVCDYIIIPAIADIDSLVGFGDLIDTANRVREESDNVSLEVLGIVFTMFAGYSINKQIRKLCEEDMGEDIIFNTYIRRSSSVLDARATGKPLAYFRPHEPVSEDYLTLTKEIIKRIKQRQS